MSKKSKGLVNSYCVFGYCVFQAATLQNTVSKAQDSNQSSESVQTLALSGNGQRTRYRETYIIAYTSLAHAHRV